MIKEVLKVIENSGSVGLSEKEIQNETNLKLNVIKHALRKLRISGQIYRNVSQSRWRLKKYQTDQEKDYNERMYFTTG